jgi:ABC-type multidrug transport system fused ATPase/permease subunit
MHAFLELGSAVWGAVRQDKLRFFVFVAFFMTGFSLELASPWAIGHVLSIFVQQGLNAQSYRAGLWGISIYVGLKFSSLLFHHVARYLEIQVAYRARLHTLNSVFGAYLSFPLPWHVNHHSGDSLSKLHRAAGAIESVVGTYIWQVIDGLVKVVFAGVALFALNFWVAVNVLGVALGTLVLVLVFSRKLVEGIRANNSFIDRLNQICVDYFSNVVTLKTLGLQQHAQAHLEQQRVEGMRTTEKVARLGELKWASIGLGYSLLIGSSLVIYFRDITHSGGVLDVGSVYVLLNYLDRVFQALGSFTGYFSGILESATAYEDASSVVRDSAQYQGRPPAAPLAPGWRELSVVALRYAYARGDDRAVHRATVRLRPGEKIALVGPSGSGKTTFLKLLGGMLAPDSVELSVDGRPAQFSALQASSLLIPQEPEVFTGTLWDNVTMSDRFSPEQLEQAIATARIQPIVDKLPNGWKTNLAESGLNLSVGEKQRIALARGLLRLGQRSFLLLDEPTSSLDPVTEMEVFQAVLRKYADRTVITACHGLTLAPLFDRIIHVRDGAFVEDGSLTELLAARGIFAAQWAEFQRAGAHATVHALDAP